jgi:lysophospholipase L1-like esterase
MKQSSQPATRPITWRFLLRVLLKTALLFAACNLIFAVAVTPESYGRLSLYNHLWPGRERLPYGENPVESYNLSLNNVPAMFASHRLAQPKTEGEFRVLLLGDSAVWGWLLPNEDTLAGQLNQLGLHSADGRFLVFYNLGYPILSLSKDLLLLDEAMATQPDLILWLVTLDSFAPAQQLNHPLLWHNAPRTRALIQAHQLPLDAADGRFITPTFWQRTLVGQRQELANWLRLQQLGAAWQATGIDQAIPAEYALRASDFEMDESWQQYITATRLTEADLLFSLLADGAEIAGDVPLYIVNEPIFISDGQNSDLRYNAWYPRWAYDQYRDLLAETAVAHQWPYLDLWNLVPGSEFTDSPVHLTAAGNQMLAAELAVWLRREK